MATTSVNILGQTTNQGSQVITLANTTVAYTLSSLQSGAIIQVPVIAAPCTITLPAIAVAVGCSWNVVCTGTLGQILTITAPANKIRGFAQQKGNGTADSYLDFVQAGTAATNTSVLLAATAIAGDRVSILCDGNFYYVQGYSAVTTNATPTFSFA